jgi:hypothetical protein
MRRKSWYRVMEGANDDAILHALAREEMLAAKRLIASGWSPQDAWRLASEAAAEIGAGWPGWTKVNVVREAFA